MSEPRMVLVKSEGWRGEIRDREVVRSHEDVLREEQESSRAEDDDYQEGEEPDYDDEQYAEDDYQEGEEPDYDDEAQHDEYEYDEYEKLASTSAERETSGAGRPSGNSPRLSAAKPRAATRLRDPGPAPVTRVRCEVRPRHVDDGRLCRGVDPSQPTRSTRSRGDQLLVGARSDRGIVDGQAEFTI